MELTNNETFWIAMLVGFFFGLLIGDWWNFVRKSK